MQKTFGKGGPDRAKTPGILKKQEVEATEAGGATPFMPEDDQDYVE